MITGIVIVQKGNTRRMYLVKPQDWLNPDTNRIQAQVPFIGGTEMIDKSNYEIGSIPEENGEQLFYVERE